MPQAPRPSVGGNGLQGSKMKPVLKILNELIRHPFAKPFALPVDPSLYPDYYTKVSTFLRSHGILHVSTSSPPLSCCRMATD